MWEGMGGKRKYLKFFRFWTPAIVPDFNGNGIFWLIPAIQFIDYDYKNLISDTIDMILLTQGGLSLKDCLEADINIYKMLVSEINARKPKKEDDNIDG